MPNRRQVLLNVFTPGRVVWEPSAFAGRRGEVLRLVDSLLVEGSCPVICGDRGLGKSSLAYQLGRIAGGDVELLELLGEENRALDEESRWVTFEVHCHDWQNADDIVRALIDEMNGCRPVDVPKLDVAKRTRKHRLKLKFWEGTWTAESAKPAPLPKTNGRTLEREFLSVASELLDGGIPRLLFSIDELDRVRDRAGLATFVKNLSCDVIKFVLVGAGDSSAQLVTDHMSVLRQLHDIHVERLADSEVKCIVDGAMSRLKAHGIELHFESVAIRSIQDRAAGHPWYVQLIGQKALVLAEDSGTSRIGGALIDEAARTIPRERFPDMYRHAYENAVRRDREVEITLRICAKIARPGIHGEMVRTIAEDLGVIDPYACLATLQTVERGQVLVRTPVGSEFPLRFRDPLFREFINGTDSVLPAVKGEVDDAWAMTPF